MDLQKLHRKLNGNVANHYQKLMTENFELAPNCWMNIDADTGTTEFNQGSIGELKLTCDTGSNKNFQLNSAMTFDISALDSILFSVVRQRFSPGGENIAFGLGLKANGMGINFFQSGSGGGNSSQVVMRILNANGGAHADILTGYNALRDGKQEIPTTLTIALFPLRDQIFLIENDEVVFYHRAQPGEIMKGHVLSIWQVNRL